MDLQTEIRKESDLSYTLLVNGKPTVERQSFAICDFVKYFLDNPNKWNYSECCEVVTRIREHFEKD